MVSKDIPTAGSMRGDDTHCGDEVRRALGLPIDASAEDVLRALDDRVRNERAAIADLVLDESHWLPNPALGNPHVTLVKSWIHEAITARGKPR